MCYKGHTPWNKGKVNVYSKETLKLMSSVKIGKSSGNLGYKHLSISKRMLENNPMKNKITRKKVSESIKKLWKNPNYKKIVSDAQKIIQNTEEVKNKQHKSHIGKPTYIKSIKSCCYSSTFQGIVWLRSSYELAYAKYLDSINEPWFYELETFDLGNSTYTPDFFLPQQEKFIEIKGWMTSISQIKIDKFREQYTFFTLEVLFKKDLINLGCELK